MERFRAAAAMIVTDAAGADPFVLEEATIEAMRAAMASGTLSSRRLVEGYLARIDAYDRRGPRLGAILLVDPKAGAAAAELDARWRRSGAAGPLHGIPVLVKDNIATQGLRTTAGSLSLAGWVPGEDATLVKKLRASGAVVLAKTNLHEFALWGETVSSLGGQTLNPYDLARTPGGSSGGTGAGIAANLGAVGIGTDTVNSIRSPASANSLVGLRPTLGLVSRTGVIPCSLTQDTAGPIARTVADTARVLNAIAGYDPEDLATVESAGRIPEDYTEALDRHGLRGARIGVLQSLFGAGPEHREVNGVMGEALAAMKAQGAVIVELTEPIAAERLVSEVSVHLYELRRDLDAYLGRLPADAPVHSLKELIASGQHHKGIEETLRRAAALSTDSAEYRGRLLKRDALRDAVMRAMDQHRLEAIVYPHQKRLVVPVGETQAERNGVLAAVTGFPALAVPAGFSMPTASAPIGVPVGIELLGRPFDEPVLFRLAYAFEQATKARKPPASTPPLAHRPQSPHESP